MADGTHPMYSRFDVIAGKDTETIGGIDRQAILHRFDPLPLARLRVFDLKRRDWLAEQ